MEHTTTGYESIDHPKHYNLYPIETIDMMVKIWGKKATASFCELNAFKYRMRIGLKPGEHTNSDLMKEKWYLSKRNYLLQLISAEEGGQDVSNK